MDNIKVLNKRPSHTDLKNGETCIYYDAGRPVLIHKSKNRIWETSFYRQDEVDLVRSGEMQKMLNFFLKAFSIDLKDGKGIKIMEDGDEYTLVTDYILARKKATSADDELAQLNCINGTTYLSDSNTIEKIKRRGDL